MMELNRPTLLYASATPFVLLDVGYRGSSLLDAAFSSVPRWTGEKDIHGLIIVGQRRG